MSEMKGRTRWKDTIDLTPNEWWKIKEANLEFRILGGHIVHITATVSNLVVTDKARTRTIKYLCQIPAATGSQTLTILPKEATTAYQQTLTSYEVANEWYADDVELLFQGASGASAMILIEYRRVHPITRKPV